MITHQYKALLNVFEALQDDFNDMKKRVEALEKELVDQKQKDDFWPALGQVYYYLDFDGAVYLDTIDIYEDIEILSEFPNVFRTEEDAEKYKEKILLKQKIIKRLNKLNGNWVPDFSPEGGNHWKFFIVLYNGAYSIERWNSYRMNKYPAKSEEIWKQIIEEFEGIDKVAEALEI